MALEVNGKIIETDEEGFLVDREDWSEEVAEAIAKAENFDMIEDHWGYIDYFRDYYEENQVHPTMNTLLRNMGNRIGNRFQDHKPLIKYLYSIFPNDPIMELCKLAGLPKPLASEHDG